ncbi:hypothetical protein O9929_18035 [Vibrio lentus]|nr:hypothetical protein [Vibrio lentus]
MPFSKRYHYLILVNGKNKSPQPLAAGIGERGCWSWCCLSLVFLWRKRLINGIVVYHDSVNLIRCWWEDLTSIAEPESKQYTCIVWVLLIAAPYRWVDIEPKWLERHQLL